MSESNPIRVYVTHAFDESDDYLRVFEFLESDDRFYYLNVAKPENIPESGGLEAIKDELIQQIKQSEVVIVLPSVHDKKADLSRFQMDVADANDIAKISIKPFGGMGTVPKEVEERCNEIVEWNEREMVDAIKKHGRGEDTARWEVIDFPGIEELMKDDNKE
ncbi:MAG: hypothetical protein QNJ05_06285 [Woeseiaceae bacterium]|nr:hypothetical protein [Woeseiaceae bacterium]